MNDEELLTMSFTLPQGFGYVLNELHFNIEQNRAADWDAEIVLRLSRPSPQLGLWDYFEVIPFNLGGRNGVDRQLRSSAPIASQLPRTPIVINSGAVHSITAQNLTATAATAGTFNGLISFWEYDLEQIAYFPVHAPAGVYSR